MSLVNDVLESWQEEIKRSSYSHPYNAIDALDDVEELSHEVIDTSPRWSDVVEVILRRGDEYVRVRYEEGSTEYQDLDHYDRHFEVIEVVPKEVTVTTYVPKAK